MGSCVHPSAATGGYDICHACEHAELSPFMTANLPHPVPDAFEIFPWSSNLETGIQEIDEQHHQLVDLLNRLAKQYVEGANEVEVTRILDGLADYADYHFRTEEAVWRSGLEGDTWFDSHVDSHGAFFARIQILRAGQEPFAQRVDSLFAYLTQWLAYHILESDNRMATALRAVREGCSFDEAHVRAEQALSGAAGVLVRTVLSMYERVSAQALALMREKFARNRAEAALQDQAALQRAHDRQALAGELARGLLACKGEAFDSALNAALRRVGETLAVDRVLVFLVADDGQYFGNAYEWCSSGTCALVASMARQPLSRIGWWMDTLARKGLIVLSDPESLPPEAAYSAQQIRDAQVKSLCAVPLRQGNDDIGFLSVDAVHRARDWSDDDIELLRLVAGMVTSALLRRRSERDSQASLARYQALFESIADAVIVADDVSGRVTQVNRQAETLFACPAHELVGRHFTELHPPVRLDAERADFSRALNQRDELFVHRSVILRADGHEVPVELSSGRRFELGGRRFHVGVFRDITTRLRDEADLQEQRERLQNAIDAIEAGTWDWNVDSGELRIDERWAGMIGYHLDELAPTDIGTWKRLTHPDDLAEAMRRLSRHFDGHDDHYEVEFRMRHRAGHWVWVRAQGRVIRWHAQGQPAWMAGVHVDVTADKLHQQQLDFVAHHDVLTRLPNRSLITDRLSMALAECRRTGQALVVAYIDLDGFADINARYGRHAADELLITLTGRLREQLRESNSLARIGGDEFAVVINGLMRADDCLPAVARLLDIVSRPMQIGSDTLSVSASIGVSTFPQVTAVDAEQLIRQADQAMYQAKLAGKNRFHVFDPEHDRTLRGRHESLEAIRHALVAGEFVLHYQPKVNMHTGELLGFEALIRWQHPERGLLPPAAFIPVIESHALSVLVGDWVIETALGQLAQWRAQGLHTSVSVNISSEQLQDPGFADRLQRQLAACPEVAPTQLELEILETGALEDMAHVSSLIERCHSFEVEFALDDFGTGYSSLTYLKRLGAQTIKIDQSFVRGMLDDPEHVAIIDSVLGLARTFGRRVVAEGIETEAHGEMLLQLGCQIGQGYGIARPMPAAAVPDWIAAWQPPASWVHTEAIRHDDVSVLIAEVEHRAWLLALQSYLRGTQSQPPALDGQRCRFSRWLASTATIKRHGDKPAYAELCRVHGEIHQLAALLASDPKTAPDDLSAGLDRLSALRDQLIDALRGLRAVA